jgi:hypothetical protein
MVVQSFYFGLNILSPFGINRQKWRLWEPSNTFSPLVQVNKSEGLYQLRVDKQRQRVDDTVRVGVEALFFAEDSISLSIYDLV